MWRDVLIYDIEYNFCASVLFTQLCIFITYKINGRLNIAEEKNSEHEKVVLETMQNKTEGKKSVK